MSTHSSNTPLSGYEGKGLKLTLTCSHISLGVKAGRSEKPAGALLRALHFQLYAPQHLDDFPSRGATPTLDTAASRELALQVFDREVYAASPGGSFESRIRTASRLLAPLGGFHFCHCPWTWYAVLGRPLKAGRYCSAHMVLSAISNSNVYHGLQTHCNPPKRAHGGLLERLSWPQHGLEATWSLPASKADTAALGTNAHPWMLLQEGHTGRGMPVAHVVGAALVS